MRMHSHILLSLILVYAFQQSPTEKMDIPALLRDAEQKTNQNCVKHLESLSDYTYKLRFVKRERRKDGSFEEESQVLEVYVPDLKKARSRTRKLWPRILIEKNGRPIAPEKIETARRKFAEHWEKDEATPPDPNGRTVSNCQWEGRYSWLTGNYGVTKAGLVTSTYRLQTPAFLTTADFHSPQYETINGRKTISLMFTPRPNSTFDENMRWAAKAEGKIWIDAEDKVFTGVAMWPQKEKPAETSAESLRKSSAIFYETVRMKDGLWFDSYRRFDAGRFPETATIWKKEIVNECFDYERFAVQAEKEKLLAPDKRP